MQTVTGVEEERRIQRALRATMRGVTLVEVLIVVAIMSLIATTVVVAVIPKFTKAQEDTALNSAREIRNAVVSPSSSPTRRSTRLPRSTTPGAQHSKSTVPRRKSP